MDSPCVQLCKLVEGKCTGCGRTKDEIHYWSKMMPSERTAIMERLERESTPDCGSWAEMTKFFV